MQYLSGKSGLACWVWLTRGTTNDFEALFCTFRALHHGDEICTGSQPELLCHLRAQRGADGVLWTMRDFHRGVCIEHDRHCAPPRTPSSPSERCAPCPSRELPFV